MSDDFTFDASQWLTSGGIKSMSTSVTLADDGHSTLGVVRVNNVAVWQQTYSVPVSTDTVETSYRAWLQAQLDFLAERDDDDDEEHDVDENDDTWRPVYDVSDPCPVCGEGTYRVQLGAPGIGCRRYCPNEHETGNGRIMTPGEAI